MVMTETEVTTRKCFNCHVEKSLEEFHKDRNKPLGRSYECKTCAKIRQTGRINNAPHSEVTKELNRQRTRQAYADNPEAFRARNLVRKLVNLGLIERQACQYSLCHKKRVDGHHPDYSKPLEVIWLCRSHHWLVERILKGSDEEPMPVLFINDYANVIVDQAVASC